MFHKVVLVIFICIFFVHPENTYGIVKISKLPDNPCTEPNMVSTKKIFNSFDTVFFTVGGRKDFSAKGHCGQIDSLDLTQTHKAILKTHDTVKASFLFSFKDQGNDTVCFWYYSCYGTWSIETHTTKCNCHTPMSRIIDTTIFRRLVKDWVATHTIENGVESALPHEYRITLRSNSTFKTFSSPDNYHSGNLWKLNDDSTFVLYLKAMELFKILELTDSTLRVMSQDTKAQIEFIVNRNSVKYKK